MLDPTQIQKGENESRPEIVSLKFGESYASILLTIFLPKNCPLFGFGFEVRVCIMERSFAGHILHGGHWGVV